MRRLIFALIFSLISLNLYAQETTPESTVEAETEIALIPFTLELGELSGVAPAEWEEIQVGSYIRDDGGVNNTYILHVAVEGLSVEDVINPFLIAYALDELPESSETYESALYEWTLYSFDFSPPELEGEQLSVDIAVAEAEEQVLLVIFQAKPEEYSDLRSQVFFPALDYFGLPLEEINAALGIETLETINLENFSIETVYPANWQVVSDGSYMRVDSVEDLTTLLIQTSPDLDEIEFAQLLLERLQLPTELPETSRLYDTDSLAWTIYTIELDTQGVSVVLSLATAQDEKQSYLVVLLCRADEAESLRRLVLFPVLDATKALE